MVKIFVGNVSSTTTEDELRALFERYGAVSDCDILKNYGFVHMEEEEAAQKAVAELHKHELNGSRLTVEYSTTKVRNATKIYVGNVPEGVSASRIKELFQRYGKVVECDTVKNYAFVHMQREKEALEAIGELNHTKLEGQKIFVSLSRSTYGKDYRDDYTMPSPSHHYPPHPHFLHPRPPPPGDFYSSRGRLPPPPPPPPPRAYYSRDAYDRGLRYDPYAPLPARYYEHDPYDRHPPSPTGGHYYRDRSPLSARRTLLPPPPPPPPPPSAGYSRGFARNTGANLAPPTAPTDVASTQYRYTLGSGFDKDDYFDDKYSNGFSRGY